MKVKMSCCIVSLGIAAGSITGIIVAMKQIVTNRFLDYSLYKLCANVLQQSLNRWVGKGLLGSFFLIIIYHFCYVLFLLVIKRRTLDRNPSPAFNRLLPFRYTTAFVMPFLIVLVGANVLPGMLSLKAYRPPVIFISIDDLRADHVGCYGYQRNTTPVIDSFAREGIIFKSCYIPEPWTLTSHMSMLTSLYPITHGVTMTHPLHPAIVTLAEVLSNAGYYTMGFVSGGPWTHVHYGFGQGFDVYIATEPDKDAAYQNAIIKKHLERERGKPLFIFIHYFDVHSDGVMLPYDAPPPFNALFSSWYRGKFTGGEGDAVASKYLGYLNRKQIRLSEDDLNYIISLYDNGIAYTDKCIGDLFAILKDMELFEEGIIIITADHGEEFQEHGYMSHGSNPYYYEESVRVPLIVKLPKRHFKEVRQGTVVENLAESIDIMPTILDFLAIAGPRMEGKSLRGVMSGGERGKKYVFGFGSGGSLFVRSERWKLLNDRGLTEGRFELFDLYDDPREQVNRSGEGLAIEEELKQTLKEKIFLSHQLRSELISFKGDVPEKTISLSEEEKEKLRSLGYLQ